MPPENQSPIEELLQQSAQQRRAAFGGDSEMPNPMRARLHEEITRVSRAAAESEPRQSWIAAYWPRLVIGAAAAAAVALGASWALWRPPEKGTGSYAIQEQLVAPPAPAPAPALPVPDPRPLVESRETEAARHPNENPQLFADAAGPPAAAPLQPQEQQPASAAADALAYEASESAPLQQVFQQTPAGVASRGNIEAPAAAAVLNNFRVEQDGSTIRIIDEDGSTYTGALVASSSAADFSQRRPAAAARAAAPAAKAKKEATAAQEFSFRASGYNNRLQQPLVFEGNYIAPAAAPNELRQSGGARAEVDEPRARVIGTARAGKAEVPVDAVAAPQPQGRARSNQ